jgi:N-acetylated-alpha-linked acidic dipeptidase
MPTTERTPLFQSVRVAPQRRRYPHSAFRRFCSIALTSTLIVAVICFFLPFAILPRGHGSVTRYLPWSQSVPKSWPQSNGITFAELKDVLLNTPNEIMVRQWSEYYTAGPHLAGKNMSQAVWTRERWEEFGVKSEIVAYDVYINYPVDHRLALLEVGRKKTKVKYECNLEEDVLDEDPSTGLADRIPTFHGYSASGNVTASYVYVNFGTFQDFEDLREANISLKGKIALAKYGRNFRGLKTKRAEELGMVGIVMYSDPQEDGEITEENGYKAYPDGPARNPSSVQRGSTQYLSAYSSSLLTYTNRCRRTAR